MYWQTLEKYGFPFLKRQIGGIVLVGEDKIKFNMHDSGQIYSDGDIFLHERTGIARERVFKWIKEYIDNGIINPNETMLKECMSKYTCPKGHPLNP